MDWAIKRAAAQAVQGKGGFSSPSEPAFIPSVLPQSRPWVDPYAPVPFPPGSWRGPASNESVTELLPMQRALP